MPKNLLILKFLYGRDRPRGFIASEEHTGLDRGGRDRSAARLHGAKRAATKTKLEQSPFSGHVLVFRGRRGDPIKVLLVRQGQVVFVRQADGTRALRVMLAGRAGF